MTTQTIRPFIGLILAGGDSSRMGADKALLEINGETLLQRNIALLKRIGAADVFISRNDFTEGSLPDIYPHHGPLSGIHSALFQSNLYHLSTPILVLPIDMPLLSEDLLICLVEAGLTMSSPVHYAEHPLPAFILNSSVVREYLETILSDVTAARPSRSVTRFLERIGAVQLSTTEAEKLVNTNTPEQWGEMVNNFIK
jgi:molybdopterin-guanine dinucleotide biosynthesis protein A